MSFLRNPLLLVAPVLALLVALGGSPIAAAAVPAPVTFAYTGSEQTYTVPGSVHSLQVAAVGGPGGVGLANGASAAGGPGGHGAQAGATISVTPGQVIYVEVGGPGLAGAGSPQAGAFNGGGAPPVGGGGGGGATDIRTVSCGSTCDPLSPSSLTSRLLVASGGGGGGGAFGATPGAAGGDAGSVGSPGIDSSGFCAANGGQGATPTAGGIAGLGASTLSPGPCAVGFDGMAGTLGSGGSGGGGSDGGGSGGGGLFGGGGGGGAFGNGGGGGGGGSSFGPTGVTFSTDTSGVSSVTITPISPPQAQFSATSLTFSTQAQTTVSRAQTLTITNGGTSALQITGLAFGGADPDDFFVGSSTCGGDIALAQSCQVTVRFTPQGTGARSASLLVTSNDPASPSTVSVSGTGAALPQGTTGPQGAPGPRGPAGPQGPIGPSGKILCRNTSLAQALCLLEFAPGSYTIQGKLTHATFRILRSGHAVLSGKLPLARHGMTIQRIGKLRRGRYVLVITGERGRTLIRINVLMR